MVGVFATVPSWGSAVLVQFGINALLLATLAQSWNIIGGYTGYPSFGNSVFYGLGGYGVAIAMVQYQLPFAVGLILGIGLAVLFAFLIGLPVLRLRGHYFAIATLGLTEVMTAIVSNLEIAGQQHRSHTAAGKRGYAIFRAVTGAGRSHDAYGHLDLAQPLRFRTDRDPGK